MFAFSGTWFNGDVKDDIQNILLYSIVRHDSVTRGAGVALYLHNSLKVTSILMSNNIEQLWVSFVHKRESIVLE